MPEPATDRFAPPLYATGLLFLVTPVVDIVLNVWPLQPGLETWRYGAVGAAANYLISMVFGGLVLALTAVRYGHKKPLRIVALLNLFCGAVLLLLAAEFALDVLQLRNVVPPGDMGGFKLGAVKAELKYLTAAAAFVLIGLAAWKSQPQRASKRSSGREGAVLMRES